MRTSAKLIIAATLAAASIIAAAELTRRSRDDPDPSPPVVTQPVLVQAPPETMEPERPAPSEDSERLEKDYRAIAERNVFRPLISAPRETGAAEAQAESSAAPAPGAPEAAGHGPSAHPAQAPDPLAEMALTGITQVGDRLRALLEHLPTRTGRYVSVGEEFHGFRVVAIRGDSVVLGRDGQERTLSLGAKRLSSEVQRGPEGAAREKVEAAQPRGPMPTPPSVRAVDIRQGFGNEMLSWAASMSLPELERLYSQYGDYLSPQQRAQAEAYLQERRARGR